MLFGRIVSNQQWFDVENYKLDWIERTYFATIQIWYRLFYSIAMKTKNHNKNMYTIFFSRLL